MEGTNTTGDAMSAEPVIKATFEKSSLAEFFGAFDALVDEFSLTVGEDGLYGSAIDPANVAMVEASLDWDAATDGYRWQNDKFAVSARKLSDQLQEFPDGEHITLSYRSDWNKLTIDSGRFEYRIPTFGPDTAREEPDVPDMDLAATVEIQGRLLSDGASFCDGFSDRVSLQYDPSEVEFRMRAEGDLDDGTVRIDTPDIRPVKQGEARSLFYLDYATDIFGAVPDVQTATLSIGQEFPYFIEYSIGTRPDHGSVRFMQAPRIQSSED